MSRKTIEQLEKEIAVKRAQIQKAKSLAKKRDRAADTRRMIVMGRLFDKMMSQERFKDLLSNQLNEYLERDTDRKLFGLEPLEADNTNGS